MDDDQSLLEDSSSYRSSKKPKNDLPIRQWRIRLKLHEDLVSAGTLQSNRLSIASLVGPTSGIEGRFRLFVSSKSNIFEIQVKHYFFFLKLKSSGISANSPLRI